MSPSKGGAAAANTLRAPQGVFSNGSRLFIADSMNSRVLIYNSIPTSNNTSANSVLGQPDMTSSASNQGGAAGANTLSSPFDVFSDGIKLFVVDTSNNRVLIYNPSP